MGCFLLLALGVYCYRHHIHRHSHQYVSTLPDNPHRNSHYYEDEPEPTDDTTAGEEGLPLFRPFFICCNLQQRGVRARCFEIRGLMEASGQAGGRLLCVCVCVCVCVFKCCLKFSCFVGVGLLFLLQKKVENQPEGRDCHNYCFHKILQICMFSFPILFVFCFVFFSLSHFCFI